MRFSQALNYQHEIVRIGLVTVLLAFQTFAQGKETVVSDPFF